MIIKLKVGEATALGVKALAGKEIEVDLYPQSEEVKVDGKIQARANPGIASKGGQRGTVIIAHSAPLRIAFWLKDASKEGTATATGAAL